MDIVTMATILLMEDQPYMREDMLAILEMAGYEAHGAENGELGLKLLQQHLPDLILCDIWMPVMDGYEVLRQVRADERFAAVPFIFVSAKGTQDDIHRGLSMGANGYLTKPFSIDDLFEIIQQQLP